MYLMQLLTNKRTMRLMSSVYDELENYILYNAGDQKKTPPLDLMKAYFEKSWIQIVKLHKEHTHRRDRCRDYLKKQKFFFKSGAG